MFRGTQTRVLLLNDMERLDRTLFRLEQGMSSLNGGFLNYRDSYFEADFALKEMFVAALDGLICSRLCH